MSVDATPTPQPAPAHEVLDTQQTGCCVVGGGPAGAVLSLLLARKGVPVMLLEAHKDFDREFRGDTIHASVMEMMDELGLADRLLELPHTKLDKQTLAIGSQTVTVADFSRLKTKFPYITVLPQVRFLDFITAEAQKYPHFQLVMGANVQELIEEDGIIRGVRYRGQGGWHEVRARLTVAADGRFSKLRQLAGLQQVKTSPPIDILWFRLPRKPEDPKGVGLRSRIGGGQMFVTIDRLDYWQLGCWIVKNSYQQLRAAGIEALRKSIAETLPEFADRVDSLQSWSQVSLLSVESNRLETWYKRGLLFIGDAAHAMSPVGGVGINYAIQDAVAAANIVGEPLKRGEVHEWDLAEVQRQRELPVRIVQGYQSFMQKNIVAKALDSSKPFQPPGFLRWPFVRDIPVRLISFGLWPVHVRD
jgi:2-polyprenyl-6-methoxyphenol hydroxylase-like FAD-dependent oxidoreductase